jgi:hypothetical protein
MRCQLRFASPRPRRPQTAPTKLPREQTIRLSSPADQFTGSGQKCSRRNSIRRFRVVIGD